MRNSFHFLWTVRKIRSKILYFMIKFLYINLIFLFLYKLFSRFIAASTFSEPPAKSLWQRSFLFYDRKFNSSQICPPSYANLDIFDTNDLCLRIPVLHPRLLSSPNYLRHPSRVFQNFLSICRLITFPACVPGYFYCTLPRQTNGGTIQLLVVCVNLEIW